MAGLSDYYEKIKMVEFTDSSITISGTEGFKKVSIKVAFSSTTNATVRGEQNATIGGKNVSDVTLEPGDTMSMGTGNKDLDGIVIIAPSGCTVQVFASSYFQM